MTEHRPLTAESEALLKDTLSYWLEGGDTLRARLAAIEAAARRDAVSVEALARAMREVLTMPVVGKYALYSYGEAASAILAAMESNRLTDPEMARAAMARPEYES